MCHKERGQSKKFSDKREVQVRVQVKFIGKNGNQLAEIIRACGNNGG